METHMIKQIILSIFFVLFSISAFADIHTRIDNCEKSKDKSCIYNLLRELAGKTTTNTANNCKCEARSGEKATDNCFMDFEARLTLDGNLVHSKCYSDKDTAYIECMKFRKSNKVCTE